MKLQHKRKIERNREKRDSMIDVGGQTATLGQQTERSPNNRVHFKKISKSLQDCMTKETKRF